MHTRRRSTWLKGLAPWIVAVANMPAMAQTAAPSGGLEEITVTAQRRSEDLQTVPISMDAITSATLENLGAKNFFDYASTVPNLTVGIGTGAGGNGSGFGVSSGRAVTIRGVAGNNTTGFYLNDTPLPLSLDPRVLDIDRVEVLRGPQGTLFGAGSMGGTVRLITREPGLDEISGKVDADGAYVNDGGPGYSVDGILNLPLVAHEVGLRVSAFSAFDPGYFDRVWGISTAPGVALPPNSPKGSDPHIASAQETGISISLAIAPSALPGLTITPTFMYQRSNSNGYPLADYTPNNLVQERPLDVPEAVIDTWTFAGVTVKYDAGFGRFIASGTYFYRNAFDLEDGTDFAAGVYPGFPYYVAAPLYNTLDTKTYNGEARFESALNGPIQFVVGVFSDQTERVYSETWNTPGANAASGGALGTDNLWNETAPNTDKQRAAFVNVSYDITARLQVSAGAREAYLEHDAQIWEGGFFEIGGSPYSTSSHNEHKTTPRFTARYEYAPDQMVYASAAEGFRIGGVNFPLPAAVCGEQYAQGSPFNSDSLWSFELGSKNAWLDGHIKSRVSAYRIDWKNIQQTTVVPCGFDVTTNSGAATSTGGEFEVDAAIADNLTANLSAGYEDAKITEAEPGSLTVAGQPLNGVPKWSGSATGQYSIPLGERTGFLRAQFTATGVRTSFNNVQTGRELAAYHLFNLRSGVDQGPWEVALFVNNVCDARGNLGDVIPESGELTGRPRWEITTPRTVGVHVRRNF
jgi:outer membrane receptor protein involved in Fe transport